MYFYISEKLLALRVHLYVNFGLKKFDFIVPFFFLLIQM